MATKTSNYQLILPGASDYYSVEDFNKNMRVIDAALKSLAEAKNGTLLEKDVSIPVSSWQKIEPTDPEKNYAYAYFFDIEDENITETTEPTVYIDEACELIAAFAGMCATAESFAGHVRLKCAALPEAEITLHCSIVGTIEPDIGPEEDTGDEEDEVPDGFEVATDEEVHGTVEDVLSGEYTDSGEGETVPNEEVASDEEVKEKISGIFGF